MTDFRCIPIDTEVADRFRGTGTDDRGHRLRRITATAADGFPCRHCLQLAATGETLLLGSYDLQRPLGVYWTPSPIFIHAETCARFDLDRVIAPIVRANSLVSLRSYDSDDQCLYDLGTVCAAEGINAPLERAFADDRAAFVNVHTAKPGCLLCRIEPIRPAA